MSTQGTGQFQIMTIDKCFKFSGGYFMGILQFEMFLLKEGWQLYTSLHVVINAFAENDFEPKKRSSQDQNSSTPKRDCDKQGTQPK